MNRAIYPGSFDPITFGHLNIIKRLSLICEELIVLIANSPKKSYLFNSEERKSLAQVSLKDLNNVKVEVYDGLVTDFAKSVGAQLIIRGVRGAADLEYEMTMASINKKLAPEIETLILPSDPEFNFVASRFVKEVAFYHGDLSLLVPSNVEVALKQKFTKRSP